MFDQVSHSICSICTCNHEIVICYDTSSLVIFPRNNFPVVRKSILGNLNLGIVFLKSCKQIPLVNLSIPKNPFPHTGPN